MPKERHDGSIWFRRSEGHHLEGPVVTANDAQQGLRVSSFGIADNGNLPRLRNSIRQRLQPLPELSG
jgi:hypothetical protein